jgi:hypothetical protein
MLAGTGEIMQRGDNQSDWKFEPSEAAMEEYYASRRLSKRPVLVFLPTSFLALGLQQLGVPMFVNLVLLGAGTIAAFVLTTKNAKIMRQADRRLKAEKREWEAQQDRPS